MHASSFSFLLSNAPVSLHCVIRYTDNYIPHIIWIKNKTDARFVLTESVTMNSICCHHLAMKCYKIIWKPLRVEANDFESKVSGEKKKPRAYFDKNWGNPKSFYLWRANRSTQLKNEVWSRAMNKPSPGLSRARALQSVSTADRPHQHLLLPNLSYDVRI